MRRTHSDRIKNILEVSITQEHIIDHTQQRSDRCWWIDMIFVTVLAGMALVTYVHTLSPGLLYGDSGEFQALGALFGMSHPTGYPVYLSIGHILTRLPFINRGLDINSAKSIGSEVHLAKQL